MKAIAIIRLFKVPKKFYEQARNSDYVCRHFYPIVVEGATIRLHDVIRSDGGHQAALCVHCGERYKGGGVFELMAWPIQS
jgi:hypothetical protein